MNSFNSCRVCLEAQAPMYDIRDSPLQRIFEKLTDMKVHLSGRSHVLCLLCYSHLKKSYKLIQRAKKSEDYFRSLMSNHTETMDIKFDIGHSLCISKTEITSNNECIFKSESTETEIVNQDPIKVEPTDTPTAIATATCTNIYDDMIGFDSLEIIKEEVNPSVDADPLAEDKIDKINNSDEPCNSTVKKPNSCKYCDNVFASRRKLSKHLRTHKDEELFACSHCDCRFKKKSELTVHSRKHRDMKTHACTYCDRKFSKKSHVTEHLRLHTGNKPYKCSYCDHLFNTKNNLTSHIRVHTGEKPYVCSECGRNYRNKGELIVHARSHSGERPYKCTLCDSKFKSKSELTKHSTSHSEEKPFTCNNCDRKFKNKRHLIDHLRKHAAATPYQCYFCDSKFKSKHILARHITIHTREKQYACSYCTSKFSRKFKLAKHLRLTHGK